MIKNKLISAAITASLCAGLLCGCGQAQESTVTVETASAAQQTETAAEDNDSKINIVTTIFPEYDWVREITKDSPAEIDTILLLGSGVDLHSYQPTAEDIMKIATCDIFVYVGGESDAWVEDALTEATNKEMTVISLLDVLGDSVKEEELVEGMDGHEHGEDSDAHEDGAHEDEADVHEHEETEYDEHVWLSLKNAVTLTNAIEKAVAEKDSDNAGVYEANLTAYKGKLNALDAKYEEAVKAGSTKTLLFGDRFPFLYMADDYDLDYYAAFAGCSAETEASFETIVFLAGKVNELGLTSICTIDNSDQKVAETIRDNTETKDQEILVLDSLQSTTTADIESGATYLSLMEKNLEVLTRALS